MTEEEQIQLLTRMRDIFRGEGYSTRLKEQEGIQVLQMRLPPLAEGAESALVELCLMDYNEYVSVLQIYSTLLAAPAPGLKRLREQLDEWNLSALAGAYGIYAPLGQLFHKYTVAIPLDGSAQEQGDAAFGGLCLALDELPRHAAEALALAAGPDIRADGR